MKQVNIIILFLIGVCASTGAQTLTHRYVELADSADRYMRLERWADAERVIIGALKHEPANPSNWLLWSNLGVVRTHRENYDGAMQAYEIGLAGAPRSTVLLSNRAWTSLAFNRPGDAMADLDATLALDSLQPWPLKMRGLLSMAKSPVKARRDLVLADSLAPDDPAVLAAIADLEAADGQIEKAQTYYERSLKLRPDPDVTFRTLLIMTEKGDFRTAQIRTSEALARWPKDPNLHLLRALQHQKNYDFDAELREKNLAVAYGADIHLVDRILNKRSSKKVQDID